MNIGSGYISPKTAYFNNLISGCGGYIFVTDPYGNTSTASNQTPAWFSPTNPIALTFLNQMVFGTDGSTIAYLVVSTGEMSAYADSFAVSGVTYYPTANALTISTIGAQNYSAGQSVWLTGSTNYAGEYDIVSTTASTIYGTSTYLIASTNVPLEVSNVVDAVPTYVSQDDTWRGRLIFYVDANNPQNIYAARVGDPFDWNYAATDPAAAWAANFSDSGQIGESVTAFIPFNDDLALVGCTNQIWLIEGDPSDGGSFVLLTDDMGIAGPYAWCTDPQHTLYFVGTSGLYSLRPFWAQYQPPQLLTGDNWDQFFEQLDRNFYNVALVYDAIHKYIHIYVTPLSGVGSSIHLVYDLRNQGLWPIQYAPNIGPTYVTDFVPGGPGVQQIVALGGMDGNIYQVDDTANDDAGFQAINSFITFAPINPNPIGRSIVNSLEIDMGETPSTYPGPVTVTTSTLVEGAGSTYAYSTQLTGTLIGTVNSTNTAFSTNYPISEDTFIVGFYWFSTGEAGGLIPTFNGGNSITLPHPILSTFTEAGTEFQTVGATILYQINSSTYGNPFNANFQLVSGAVAVDVNGDDLYPTQDSTSNSTYYQTWINSTGLDRRQPSYHPRLGGAWFGFTISNSTQSTTWSFEKALVTFQNGGLNRQQR